jgi:hypothetical protein
MAGLDYDVEVFSGRRTEGRRSPTAVIYILLVLSSIWSEVHRRKEQLKSRGNKLLLGNQNRLEEGTIGENKFSDLEAAMRGIRNSSSNFGDDIFWRGRK